MKGKVAILANGSSLRDHDLSSIDCETIGLNGSWRLHRSTYHVMTDSAQWELYRRENPDDPELERLKLLVTGPKGPGGLTVPIRKSHRPKWSSDPRFGFYLCGTVTYLALQLAVHAWGYSEIVLLGLDLYPDERGRGKFYGGQWHPSAEPRQRESFAYASALLQERYGIDVWNVNPRSKCAAFRFKSFGECFGGDGGE